MLRPISAYARELRPALPSNAFAPARSRMVWFPVHLAVIVVATLAIAMGWAPWFVVPLLSVAIGVSFAGLTFLAHEVLHGGIVRSKRLRHVIGWVSFLPFVVSPRLWIFWHNQIHHGHTAQPEIDPDGYPTLEQYEKSRLVRFVTDNLALGPGHRAGAVSVLFGFTFQNAQVLLSAHKLGMTKRAQRAAIAESVAGVCFWGVVAALIGFVPLLFAFILPLVLANTIVMTYILTNHCLSPHTPVNDPLVNSLSVTAPRWYEWITLRFGFHVEHHLFPAMSSRHAPAVRALLRERYPERYQSMPIGRALRRLAETGRAYKSPTQHLDPRTGLESPTLAPRPRAAPVEQPQPLEPRAALATAAE